MVAVGPQVGTGLKVCEMTCPEHGQDGRGRYMYAHVHELVCTRLCASRHCSKTADGSGARTGEPGRGHGKSAMPCVCMLGKETKGFNSSLPDCLFELQSHVNI